MVIKGGLNFPGDKSISHRALMLASLADGDSKITNLATGADVMSTRLCLEWSGIKIRKLEDHISVTGGKLIPNKYPLNCGNSGTTARLMMGMLAGQRIKAMLSGDESLSGRPMDRILKPLSKMGLTFESENGTLPVLIHSNELKGIDYVTPVASAQVKSAILLAVLGAQGDTILTENIKTRDHTELMLKKLGANIKLNGLTTTITAMTGPLENFEMKIPGDPSTAAFFVAAAALIPDSELILQNVLTNPTRIGFFHAISAMGVGVDYINKWQETGETAGTMKINCNALQAINIGKDDAPALIDEIPILAVMATQAEGRSSFTGLKELRVKECDRIHAICSNLKRMGARIEERDDGFVIDGGTGLKGIKVETFNDHRIAMAFTVAGLIAKGKTSLDNPKCIAVSYPEFFKVFKGLIH